MEHPAFLNVLPLVYALGLIVAALLILWVISLIFFQRQRARARRKMHKMLGLMTIKNSHEIKALKENEEKLKNIIDLMNEGLILTGPDHQIIYVNKCACGQLKRGEQDILGKKMSAFAVGHPEAARLDELQQKARSGATFREEFHMVRGDQELFWASLSFSFPRALKGLKKGAIIVMTEVTQHILTEEKMRKLTNNLVQKVRQLDCVFDMQQMLSETGSDSDAAIRKALKIIPRGLRYERDMRVEIVYHKKVYQSHGYQQTQWIHKTPMKSGQYQVGHIAVSYVGPPPPRHSQPFKIGEKVLLRNLADKLVKTLEAV
ncbi:MAG: PAS domain S-box protein [Bacteroidales bacterium]|nr:PAS domain S-box protein [Bacteroidales bacterium]